MSEIKFGTDGWRALMSRDFTFENVEKVAQAFCDYLATIVKQPKDGKRFKIAVGYDYRKNSENFARTFAEVTAANGVRVLLSDAACPTPAVSYLIVRDRCDSGIILTASHNPPDYNGIKIKTDFGGSAEKAITDAVEKLIGRSAVKKTPVPDDGILKSDFNKDYLDYLKNYVDVPRIKAVPFRVLVDSMHGVGAKHLQEILAGGRLAVTTIRSERDISFGGTAPEPIAKNFPGATEKLKGGSFDLGIVTDGDADRVGAIRPGGEFISPGTILSLIMLHLVEDLGRTGSVVTTISNTMLIYKIAKKLGLKVHETPVGFKYVCEIMRRENVLIGGEESGGIGFQNYLYERDGMLSGLLLMQMMAVRNQNIDQILSGVEKEFGKLYYVREDTHYPDELKAKLFAYLDANPPKSLEGHPVKEIKKTDGVKIILEDDSWLLFRLSGTEPILRIYSEASSLTLAQALVARGKALAFNLP